MCWTFMSFVFFFFKQKTAYEMRISDWSSDVCSSDLKCVGTDIAGVPVRFASCVNGTHLRFSWTICSIRSVFSSRPSRPSASNTRSARCCQSGVRISPTRAGGIASDGVRNRSEEHTSELQSLMRISYAVFCLNKKKQTHTKKE